MNKLKFLRYLTSSSSVRHKNLIYKTVLETSEINRKDFGVDFSWGVATAAYQIEGAWDSEGKGESIWDRFTNKAGNVKDKTNGNDATDFYNRYESDLKLLKNLNFKNFRFSFSWPRILPDGTGKINDMGIDFYNRMIDHCLELGIEPWAMLYHWDLPQKLSEKGGWTNRDIVGWFSEYSDLCTRRFGDRIQHWMVLNEPASFTTLGYLSGMHAPQYHNINKFLASVHHACLCQAEGGRIIRNNIKNSHVGTTFSCAFTEPHKELPSHQRASQRLDVMLNRLFIEPSLGMGYPYGELPFIRKIDKFILPQDVENLKFEFDFIGVQNYFRVISKPSLIPFIWANRVKPDDKAEVTEMGWEVSPEGIYNIIMQFAKYPIKEIIVTENGAAFPDKLVDGQIHDQQRISYFKQYLHNVLKAKNDGANVTGYFAWTFIDNFEWDEGFRPRFGIVYNDFNTQQRTVKDSGLWFSDFLSR
ncbi:MAG: GH1 family beta-glucosidase [Mariniphaga sp.]